LDPLSAVLAIAAVLAMIFGLTQVVQDGLAPLPIAAVVAGLLIGMVWVRRQRRLADPMIDLGLFRLPTFNAALTVNFLAIFVAVGYFLFVAQYLQLVAGLSPFEAGLLSLPSAIGFVIGSQAAPRIVSRVRPPYLIRGGLALGSFGLVLLTQVPTSGGLVPLVIASLVISLGLAPVFGLATQLIDGSSPPGRGGGDREARDDAGAAARVRVLLGRTEGEVHARLVMALRAAVESLLARLAHVGADPFDDEDARLRKALLVLIAVLVLPIAFLW